MLPNCGSLNLRFLCFFDYCGNGCNSLIFEAGCFNAGLKGCVLANCRHSLFTAALTAAAVGADRDNCFAAQVVFLQEGEDDIGAGEPPDREHHHNGVIVLQVLRLSLYRRTCVLQVFQLGLAYADKIRGGIFFYRLDSKKIGTGLLGGVFGQFLVMPVRVK